MDKNASAGKSLNTQSILGKNIGTFLASNAVTKTMEKIFAKQIIAIKLETKLQYVSVDDIVSLPAVHAKARYLYWACFRGHANLVKLIIEQDKISPFARIYEGRSPMMASLLGKQAPLKN